ncbi:MAG TPA: hypothetical protein VFV95_22055 [Vicinamibacterales bacterium]|nr:hypothetical protein [Vicinamibacterales bacterium]
MRTTTSLMIAAAVIGAAIATPVGAQQGASGVTDEQIETLVKQAEANPKDPELHYRLAAAYWAKACVPRIAVCEGSAGPIDRRAQYVQSGLLEADKTLAIRPDYLDALVYKGLLLRANAVLEPEPQMA